MKITNIKKDEMERLIETNNEEFVIQLYKLVAQFCHKYNIFNDDTLHELICHVFSRLHTFDDTKSKFSTWCFLVCKNKFFMDYRKENAVKRKSNMNTLSLNVIVDECEYIELMDLIEDSSNKDDDYKKSILEKVYGTMLSDFAKSWVDGKTQEELACELGISQAQVSRRLKKEFTNIKRRLERDGWI